MRDEPAPTLEHVASLAGVSRASASRALRGEGKVSDETRIRVREVAASLGYVPNTMASSLASGPGRTIGLLLREPANPAYGLLYTVLQREAAAAGLRVVAMTISADPRHEGQIQALHDLLGMRVRALVVATGGVPSDQLAPFTRRVPILRLGRPEMHAAIHAVSYDEEHAGRTLAQHVVEAGHRSVAVLRTPREMSYPEDARARAMLTCLEKLGARTFEVPTGPDVDHGVTEALDAVDDHGATAVMAPNDLRALEVLRAAKDRGLQAGYDVSVTGCDGATPGLDLLGLATMRIPIEDVAREGIARVMDLLEQGSTDGEVRHQQVRSTWVPGTTLGPPR